MDDKHTRVAITGGSSGIGFACAKRYAACGCDLAIIARDGAKLAHAKEDLMRISQTGVVHTVSADLSDEGATRAAFEMLRQIEGFEPDILINSAGVIIPGEFSTMSSEDFRANIDSGFWTVVNPCKVVVPWMKERKSGHIVNVSSVAGYMGIYGYTGYSAAKFAAFGFTEALRCELKPEGVHVHVVCPPDTKTDALARERELRPKETEAIAGSITPVEPQVIADAIFKGVKNDKYLIVPGFISKLYFRVKGLFPEFFFAVIDSDVRKVRRRSKTS